VKFDFELAAKLLKSNNEEVKEFVDQSKRLYDAAVNLEHFNFALQIEINRLKAENVFLLTQIEKEDKNV
jgi:hypothetical protein